MAARRGVAPADRARLTAAIEAVLSRDPSAIQQAHAHLEALRDRAATELNFEHAGRIQDEIQALAWITSPQRVHTTGGGDHVVTAWSHGVQVSFDIRDGRLCTWSQRRAARPPVTVAPEPWATFAQRNAELAAGLSLAEPIRLDRISLGVVAGQEVEAGGSSVADQSAGQVQESGVVRSLAVVAAGQAPEPGHPLEAAFDDVAIPAEFGR